MSLIKAVETNISQTEKSLIEAIKTKTLLEASLLKQLNESTPTLLLTLLTSFCIGWLFRRTTRLRFFSYSLIEIIINSSLFLLKKYR